MSDFDALFANVEKAGPDEPQPLLVMADWCQDHDEPHWSYALKWCAGHRRRPFRRHDVLKQQWVWVRRQKAYRSLTRAELAVRASAVLPAVVFDHLGGWYSGDVWQATYMGARPAYLALVKSLQQLRMTLDVPDLPPELVRPTEVELTVCRQCGISRAKFVELCPVCKSPEVLG